MTEENQAPVTQETADQNEPKQAEATFTQKELDAIVSKAVASATAPFENELKKIQEASMTEKELMDKRMAEETAKQQAYIASLERETRVNYAKAMLSQYGLPATEEFAEVYAGFDKDVIKQQIEAQGAVLEQAKQAELAKFAQENAPKGKMNIEPANTGKTYVSPRSQLEQLGLV